MHKSVSRRTGWLARVALRAAAGSVDQALFPAPPRLPLVIAWLQPRTLGNSSLVYEVS